MQLKLQKRLAATLLDCSHKRVIFDTSKLSQIKESITKEDIRGLIHNGTIREKAVKGVSRFRAKARHSQRLKGRQHGAGRKKGKASARAPDKQVWMARIRLQRVFLKALRESKHISGTTFRTLYMKAKGGYFRSKRHIQLYLTEHRLFEKDQSEKV